MHGTVESNTLYSVLGSLASIALPSVLLQLSILFPFTLSTSHLGGLSYESELSESHSINATQHDDSSGLSDVDNGPAFTSLLLSSFSLSNLTGNITCLTVLIGTLSATDTLGPQYFALSKGKVGLLLLRGFFITSTLLGLLSLKIPADLEGPI